MTGILRYRVPGIQVIMIILIGLVIADLAYVALSL